MNIFFPAFAFISLVHLFLNLYHEIFFFSETTDRQNLNIYVLFYIASRSQIEDNFKSHMIIDVLYSEPSVLEIEILKTLFFVLVFTMSTQL